MSIANQQAWLSSALGQYFQTQELMLYQSVVGDIFGFNALQIGMPELPLLNASRIPLSLQVDNAAGDVQCEFDYLPFQASSIDMVLLPHALEFSDNPHQVLREVERVLVPEGTLLLTGFNPLSAWGFKRLLTRQKDFPWLGRFLPLLRIKDWLALLGFEVEIVQMACYAPPCAKAVWLNRFAWLDRALDKRWPMMGGVYFIVAKKRVAGTRLIKPNWKKASLQQRLLTVPSQKQPTQKQPSQKNKNHFKKRFGQE